VNSVADAVPLPELPKSSAPDSSCLSLATVQPRGRVLWLPKTQGTAVMPSKHRQKLEVAHAS